MMLSANQNPHWKFSTNDFRKKVARRYASEKLQQDLKLGWCPLTGWHMAQFLSAAHIVPKEPSAEELSYLFVTEGNKIAMVEGHFFRMQQNS